MRNAAITVLAVLAAVIGWWGLFELTGATAATNEPGTLLFLFALLFLAVTATLVPPAAFLNRRFAPNAVAKDPYRFIRHSSWGGICVTVWGWLQYKSAFNLGFVLLTVLIFIALEFLIARLKGDAKQKADQA